MKSRTTEKFRKMLSRLPQDIQLLARNTYQQWKINPYESRLEFKEIESGENLYSVRIGYRYRALGRKSGDSILWFWIGTHQGYNNKV